jgi:hypothetical protein
MRRRKPPAKPEQGDGIRYEQFLANSPSCPPWEAAVAVLLAQALVAGELDLQQYLSGP